MTPQRFNELALRLNLPIHWTADTNGNGQPDPTEIRTLLFHSTSPSWTRDGEFTDAFHEVATLIAAEDAATATGAAPRHAAAVAALDRYRVVDIHTDLTGLSVPERVFARAMYDAALGIDELFAHQIGLDVHASDDAAVASIARLTWDTRWLEDVVGTQVVDVWPPELQHEGSTFCAEIQMMSDRALWRRNTVVRLEGGVPHAVAYSEAYSDRLRPVIAALRRAAQALSEAGIEAAMVDYLLASAARFESDDWREAARTHVRLIDSPGAWFVRAGASDVGWEPCYQKGGYALLLGRVNASAVPGLVDLVGDIPAMESALAALLPEEYPVREPPTGVPLLVEVVFRAGHERFAPNAGTSEHGIVVLTNAVADEFSHARYREILSRLVTPDAIAHDRQDALALPLGTTLHEISHHLGPSYEDRGSDVSAALDTAFGPGLADSIEEVRAESSARFLLAWEAARGRLEVSVVEAAFLVTFARDLERLAGDLGSTSGRAGILRLGMALDAGAIAWDEQAISGDGHTGAFRIDFARLPEALAAATRQAMHIEAALDRQLLDALLERDVQGDALPLAQVRERLSDLPWPDYEYSVDW